MKSENQPILIIDFLNIFTRHFTVNPTLNKEGIPIAFELILNWIEVGGKSKIKSFLIVVFEVIKLYG